jgi:phosphomevalonate kinase
MISSAPGKVLWAGEYAVLEGHPAILTAVDRRAVARLAPAPAEPSPFLAAVADEIRRRLGAESRAAADAARIVVDSRELASGGKKLGLGSSAAATVAATALALRTTEGVHEIAHAAHAAAQAPRGSRGSGADIAAAVHGGTILARRTGDGPLAVTRLPDPPVAWLLLWTGQPADTPSLVARTRALRDRDPAGYDDAIGALGAAADALAAAFAAGSPDATLAAVAQGASALADLGSRSGAPLLPAGFREWADRIARFGGVAKPTGAGGGDLILVAFPPDATRPEWPDMTVLTPRVDPRGVVLAPDRENAYT